ncbi:polysaccharide biosynthesis protein [Rossellomorea marisflavi]|uniref:Polysaccharide biosynthesis protein n=1 Tax=Rossellomorea marisflavi TaxID=189381 RepID=A0A0M0FZB4_9BACI|nr:oligosaccharide flippase family protein [Rossellomorea marisflavi]KON82894.1 polysaccharide biosynthesis protein [Rossellomorea marisflavi]
MKAKVLKLIKIPFIRNVAIMASGTALAQAITMALSPLITRIYGPEAFGILGVFVAITGIVAPLAALTYPIAIVLPKREDHAKGLMRLSLYISILIASFVAIILSVFNENIVNLFNIESVAPYLYLIPVVILCAGFLQVVEQWLIRKKQFRISANASIIQAVLLQGGKVVAGLFFPVASILIIFTAFGEGIKALFMALFTSKFEVNKIRASSNCEKINLNMIAKKYVDFPKYRAPEVLFNAISQSLPVLMLASFFGPSSVGFYTIGRSVLSMPTILIGKSVGDVFYPRISDAEKSGEDLLQLIKKATLMLGIIGILPFGIIILFGPVLFSFIFGPHWLVAGEYARWIALWSFFGFINIPSVRALPVLGAQSFHLKFTILMLLTRIIVLAIGYYAFSSDQIAVALFGISGAVLNVFLILSTLKISKIYLTANTDQ